ncbi:MAG TPA: hypothetical protein DEQ17_01050 [Prevotella sp.]|nr:hypothetical protein [Prevotella sp.]
MKDLQPNILDDYEHLVSNTIKRWGGEPDFPTIEGVNSEELDDYLFEYQSILDSEGSQKTQLTKYGIVAIIPIIILSAFPESMLPWGKYTLVTGVAIGVAIALCLKGLTVLLVKSRLRRLRKAYPKLADYSAKVMAYRSNKL